MKFLYTDIDYVLSLGCEIHKHETKWGLIHKFNDKAVKVYNDILLKTGAEPIISSDWRHHFTLEQFGEIFLEWAKITKPPIDYTPHIPGATPLTLAEHRAKEILKHVNEHKPESWVAIDDLDLSTWIPKENFVHLRFYMEGVKQSGKRDQIIKKLNKNGK